MADESGCGNSNHSHHSSSSSSRNSRIPNNPGTTVMSQQEQQQQQDVHVIAPTMDVSDGATLTAATVAPNIGGLVSTATASFAASTTTSSGSNNNSSTNNYNNPYNFGHTTTLSLNDMNSNQIQQQQNQQHQQHQQQHYQRGIASTASGNSGVQRQQQLQHQSSNHYTYSNNNPYFPTAMRQQAQQQHQHQQQQQHYGTTINSVSNNYNHSNHVHYNMNNNNDNNNSNVFDHEQHNHHHLQQQQGRDTHYTSNIANQNQNHNFQSHLQLQQQQQHGPNNIISRHHHHINNEPTSFVWTRVLPSSSSSSHLSQTSSHHHHQPPQSLPVLPPPRSGAASVVVQDQLYIFGGYGGGTGRLDDFYSYNFITQSWNIVPVLSNIKPGCRENNGVVISDSSHSIYLFGGYNGDCWLNDLWKYDIETQHWTCIQESSGPSSSLSSTTGTSNVEEVSNSNNDDIVINNNDTNENVSNSIQLYNNHGISTTTNTPVVKGKVPTRRFGYVSVVHNGKFVLFGGFDGSRWLNDMYVFDFPTATWTEIQAGGILPSARSCPAWAKDSTYVYIQGGYDGVERKSDFFAFNLETYVWTEMPSLGTPPSPRYFHSCCLYGHRMYLYGGYSGSERLADMYAYDFDTNHWSQVDCTRGDAPSGRSSLVTQVYNNSIYVFGGYNGTTVLNDFFRFRLKPIGIPPPALVNDLHRLMNNSDLADVRFLVEGRIVYAHKAILAIRSEYFRVMLCGGMRESRMMMNADTTMHDNDDNDENSSNNINGDTDVIVDVDNDSKPSSRRSLSGINYDSDDGVSGNVIDLPDIPYNVFMKVLEFLYTDTVSRDSSSTNATTSSSSLDLGIQLLIASEQFMLDRLKSICEDILRQDINVETVVLILVASYRYHAIGLKEIAFEFILRHLNNPVVMNCLAELKAEPDLLLEIIRRS